MREDIKKEFVNVKREMQENEHEIEHQINDLKLKIKEDIDEKHLIES